MKAKTTAVRWLWAGWLGAVLVTLAACGGGSGGSSSGTASTASSGGATASTSGSSATSSGSAGTGSQSGSATTGSSAGASVSANWVDGKPASRLEASRFLARTTFGPKPADIDRLMEIGYRAWIDEQFSRSYTAQRPFWDARKIPSDKDPATIVYTSHARFNYTTGENAFWRAAITSPDQLRWRVAQALMSIYVLADGMMNDYGRGGIDYMDRLARGATANFRDLIEEITLHPLMGMNLSHVQNRKEDTSIGRVPDQNYAREVMQLFTIGLHELNQDGSVKRDSSGEPIPAYGQDDVVGLSYVFTGMTYSSDTRSGWGENGSQQPGPTLKALIEPMRFNDAEHSKREKRFLGVTVPAGGTTASDLKVALDTLFKHPNVGPFIGKQLIQRLVTSNPSPAYIQRVASAFNDNGKGVRGDMGTVIRAVLLDPEAFATSRLTDPKWGKVREPNHRLANLFRLLDSTSNSSEYLIHTSVTDPRSLRQGIMNAYTVFNHFRPNYTPTNSPLVAAEMVAPEMQIVDEITVALWSNVVQNSNRDHESYGATTENHKRDVAYNYTELSKLASDPQKLVDQIDLLTAAGLSDAKRKAIAAVVQSIGSNADQSKRRVQQAVTLVMSTPEYIVQK